MVNEPKAQAEPSRPAMARSPACSGCGELVGLDLAELEKRAEELRREIAPDRKARVRKGERGERLIDERKELACRIDKRDERLDELEELIAKERRASMKEALNRRACIDGATTWLCNKPRRLPAKQRLVWCRQRRRSNRSPLTTARTSQAELFECFQRGVPGRNPANPPGTGSHEGINGGNCGTSVTSKFAVGAKLPHYFWGLDPSDPEQARDPV